MLPSIELLSDRIKTDLLSSRRLGKSTPANPVNAETICGAYKTLYNWVITDREIRAATKYLVEEKNIPIGTTLDGCYYVLISSEWQPTLDMLMPKFLSLKRKIDAIQKMKNEMAAQEQGQMDMPLMKVLNDNLELEKQ